VIARVRVERQVISLGRAVRAAPTPIRYRRVRTAPSARPEPRREKDFLERQGYIY
jgi:hypothetical protein